MKSELLFRAFSDPTRLRILHLLRLKEHCVGDLMSVLRLPQAKTSRHLAYLRRGGLVRAREEGLWSYYSLVPVRTALHRRLMACLDVCPRRPADTRRSAALRKGGGCCPR